MKRFDWPNEPEPGRFDPSEITIGEWVIIVALIIVVGLAVGMGL